MNTPNTQYSIPNTQYPKHKGNPLKIAIIGCGAIGTSLARAVSRDFRGTAQVTALFDIDDAKSRCLAALLRKPALRAASLDRAISRAGLVIEAAHADSSLKIARAALSAGRDVMVMSVGGIVNGIAQLKQLARRKGARIYVTSGAICGIDALKAARMGRIQSVTLTTRKNPLSFSGVACVRERKIDLKKIKKDTVLFSGSARRAMKLFPQNVNVAGVLSLAGLGPDTTTVTIIASPKARRNMHEVTIKAEAGTVTAVTENVLHPQNPKTSFLAVLSALAKLKQITEPLSVGT